jgi:hypothetical protein
MTEAKLQTWYRESAEVLAGMHITTIQVFILVRPSGIFKSDRYIDASALKDWRQAARNWSEKLSLPRTERVLRGTPTTL